MVHLLSLYSFKCELLKHICFEQEMIAKMFSSCKVLHYLQSEFSVP